MQSMHTMPMIFNYFTHKLWVWKTKIIRKLDALAKVRSQRQGKRHQETKEKTSQER